MTINHLDKQLSPQSFIYTRDKSTKKSGCKWTCSARRIDFAMNDAYAEKNSLLRRFHSQSMAESSEGTV